jgi:hypothetical protein
MPDLGVVGDRLTSTGLAVDSFQPVEKARRRPSQERLAAMEAIRDLRVNWAMFKSTNNALAARGPPALSAFYAEPVAQECGQDSILQAEPAEVERNDIAQNEEGLDNGTKETANIMYTQIPESKKL